MSGIGEESGRGVRGFRAPGLLMLMLMAVGFQGIVAQEKAPSSDEEVDGTLLGQVVDARTGEPLIGAFVRVEGDEWGSLSDAEGNFSLPEIQPGVTSIAVEQLGYITLWKELEVKEPRQAVVLRVQPDPVLLDGVQFVLDGLERRRNATATSSWVFDREDLMANPTLDALAFLKSKTPARLVPCSISAECALVHGRVSPVSVWVDEMPFLGGMDYLRAQQPFELQRIEVFGGGRHIRVYTSAFLKRAGTSRLQPNPFIV